MKSIINNPLCLLGKTLTGLCIFSVDFVSTFTMITVTSGDFEPRSSMGRRNRDWDGVKFGYEISCVSS